MFLNFYGLREQPFGVTPDPEFLYLSSTHREALASVAYGIQAGVGFAAMIAKPGMGKTTLLFALLRHFQHSAQSAFLFDTQCNSRELLQSLLAEFRIQEDSGKSEISALAALRQFLLKSARANQRVLLVVDEAQNLDIPVFETLRLLSNFETPQAKLLHIVLAGQPELGRKLALPELDQLRQRITIVSRLDVFAPADVIRYVAHRLKRAGYQGGPLFTPEALGILVDKSHGVPREINRLCFNAMSLGCALGKKLIDGQMVREAAADLEFDSLLNQKEAVQGDEVSENPVPEALAALFSTALKPAAPGQEEAERITVEQKLPPEESASPLARESERQPQSAADLVPERPKTEIFNVNLRANPAAIAPASRQSRRPGFRHFGWLCGLLVVAATVFGGLFWLSNPQSATTFASQFAPAMHIHAVGQSRTFQPPASASEEKASEEKEEKEEKKDLNSGGPASVLAAAPPSPRLQSASTAAAKNRRPPAVRATAPVNAAPAAVRGNRNQEKLQPIGRLNGLAAPTADKVPATEYSAAFAETPVMSYFARSGVGALAGSDVAAAPASQIANQAAMPPAPETTPKLIKRVDPQYPQLASSSGISGGVVLNAHIDEAGKVQAVQAISGDPVLVRAAVDAVRQWEYQPSLVDGQPRQSDMRIVITFSPQ
jgi:general secretion pathway protein A